MPFLKPILTALPALWLFVANASLDAPRLGFVLLPTREVWSLRGVTGAYYLGQFTGGEVDEMTFNGNIGLRTSGAQADLLGPNGEVLRTVQLDGSKVRRIGLSTIEDTAFVLTQCELWRISRDRADRFTLDQLAGLDDTAGVAGISGAGPYVELALVSDGQISVRRIWLDGSSESILRETYSGNPRQYLFLPEGMSLWCEDGVLFLRRADGSTVHVDTEAPVARVDWMGKNLIHASAAAGDSDERHFAVHVAGSPNLVQDPFLRVNQLPESPQ